MYSGCDVQTQEWNHLFSDQVTVQLRLNTRHGPRWGHAAITSVLMEVVL